MLYFYRRCTMWARAISLDMAFVTQRTRICTFSRGHFPCTGGEYEQRTAVVVVLDWEKASRQGYTVGCSRRPINLEPDWLPTRDVTVSAAGEDTVWRKPNLVWNTQSHCQEKSFWNDIPEKKFNQRFFVFKWHFESFILTYFTCGTGQ